MNDPAGRAGADVETDERSARGILLTHGSMCHGMVDAVRRITGVGEEALVAVSNEGRSPEALLEAVLAVTGPGPTVIFADMPSGSCALTARFICRDPGNRTVVFGTNLPMLLDFVFHRDLPLGELVERLTERGRSAIRALEPREEHADRTVSG